jgi:hypothetical protein
MRLKELAIAGTVAAGVLVVPAPAVAAQAPQAVIAGPSGDLVEGPASVKEQVKLAASWCEISEDDLGQLMGPLMRNGEVSCMYVAGGYTITVIKL